MYVARVTVTNFRGIRHGQVHLDGHALLAGGNSVGKSTLCEALDLVLGPERMFRRPVVDEYDFHGAKYLAADGTADELIIEVVLLGLSPAAERRFGGHLRKWNAATGDFADIGLDDAARAEGLPWCLPVLFCGRFNVQEDDFEGGTFFAHPEPVPDDLTAESERLGGGRRSFTREDKRQCGFLYLRPHRTGSRALSLQRGSLLDTIVRLEAGPGSGIWERLRDELADVSLADEGSALEAILDGLTDRIRQFVSIGSAAGAVQLHASDLTRESIREAVRVFIATKPGEFPVPFGRLSTGSLNLLVFALLTYIAELHGETSVIFAIEEPEMALPPHAQRRLVDFALANMGQTIVTSHSPYVIERFAPERILVLRRDDDGLLSGGPLQLPADFKLKRYRENRRQFAEAVLARAVLVVEGATEASVIPVVADVLEADPGVRYSHLDLTGVSILDAGNDVSVPLYAPLFKSLGKPAFGLHDAPTKEFAESLRAKAADFCLHKQLPYAGIEDLLVAELPIAIKRRFLERAATFHDYPGPTVGADAGHVEVDYVLRSVLKARKGANTPYAAELVSEASNASELPQSIVKFLLAVDRHLGTPVEAAVAHDGLEDGLPKEPVADGPSEPAKS